MINLLLFLLISFLFGGLFTLTMYFYTRKGKQKRKLDFKGGKYIERIGRLSVTAKLNEYLKGGGNPNGVTGEALILIHIFAMLVMLLQLLDGQSKNISLTALIVLMIDAVIINAVNSYKTKLISELCDIQDIFYYQSKINTPQDVILAYAARQSEEPLKSALENLLTNYKYRQKDITKIFDEFRKTSNAMELQSFSFILEQREINGFSGENHEAQSIMLKRAKRIRRRMIRKTKRLKLVIASVMLFVCYTGFITLPIAKQIYSKWSIIFR